MFWHKVEPDSKGKQRSLVLHVVLHWNDIVSRPVRQRFRR